MPGHHSSASPLPDRAAIKVMIVDDSAPVRRTLAALLAGDDAVAVIGAAGDPLHAMEVMAGDWPDVILLDVEMPGMDGMGFLRRVMRERPTPVVICSTLNEYGIETTRQALAAGAVAVVAKPRPGLEQVSFARALDLLRVVKAAARADLTGLARASGPTSRSDAATPPAPPAVRHAAATETIVALGASLGGTRALELVLSALPVSCPGIVVVQHMPEKFTDGFARGLDRVCRIAVREARHGDRVLPGTALIAPGGRHMRVKRSGGGYVVEITDDPHVNRHRPAVDVLFGSLAQCAGPNALGVIMTGMGDDGARGLRAMRDAGAHTIAQDEASCVVYGMPKQAVRMDAACAVLPLGGIAAAIQAEGRLRQVAQRVRVLGPDRLEPARHHFIADLRD
ncbi:chemotaxis response regulator protein-glutamate methylesterase [Oxalobacteraceae bacterium OTU3REALA1]|nr:chemotaxis response regulator protein-glutamate methylesterase [Oxalobacteraceae bacterium OTU3REALA1]